MTHQTREITPLNNAFFVAYCKQNKIKVNEAKIENYVVQMQQPLTSGDLKKENRIVIFTQATVQHYYHPTTFIRIVIPESYSQHVYRDVISI